MTVVGAPTRAPAVDNAGATLDRTPAQPPLLPTPSPDADPSAGMALLYKLMSERRDGDLTRGEAQVAVDKRQKEADLAASAQALANQQDAKDSAERWGVFSKVASVVVTVVSAVAACFTCGAASGLLVASVCLSAAAFAEQQFHVVGTITNSDAASTGTSIGLGVLSAICSFGATAASSGAAVGAQAGATIAEAGAQAGQTTAQTSASVGMAVTGCTQATSKVIAGAAEVTEGVGQVVQGATQVGSAAWSYAASEDAIDGKQAEQHAQRLDRLIAWVIDGVKETSKSHERALQTLHGAIQTKDQTLVMTGSMRA